MHENLRVAGSLLGKQNSERVQENRCLHSGIYVKRLSLTENTAYVRFHSLVLAISHIVRPLAQPPETVSGSVKQTLVAMFAHTRTK